MVKKQRSKAQNAALNAGRAALAQKRAPDTDTQAKHAAELLAAEKQLEVFRAELQAERIKGAQVYKTLRAQRRKAQRAVHIRMLKDAELKTMEGNAKVAIQLLDKANAENQELKGNVSRLLDRCAMGAANAHELYEKTVHREHELLKKVAEAEDFASGTQKQLSEIQEDLKKMKQEKLAIQENLVDAQKEFKHQIKIMKLRCSRIPQVKETVLKKVQKENRVYELKKQGVYTAEARALARILTEAGCSPEYVGNVIEVVCGSTGIKVVGKMSRRTVGRAITEGGVAAKMQLGHELLETQGFTTSGDGTTNRHVAYDAHHIHLMAEDYTADDSSKKIRQTRFAGITSSPDQSSEQEVLDWKEAFDDFLDLYKKSPMGENSSSYNAFIDILSKWFGSNTDHCAKEKKAARLMADEKRAAIQAKIGENEVKDKTFEEINMVVAEERFKVIEDLGGQTAWDALPAQQRAEKETLIMNNMLIAFGQDRYDKLSSREKLSIDLFIWTGCGCHKDANTVKGGNKAMMDSWKKHNLPAPVLLANQDNEAIILEIEDEDPDSFTPAQARALDVTSCGGVKASSIAGFLFNHKDDKKGQQDTFKYWFKQHGISVTFPDTSNTRYGSHCEAAAFLIQYLDEVLEFLQFIHDSKDKKGFTHLEANLKKALQCQSTITELIVLTLYAQSITHPYMSQIRGPGKESLNMLNAGPLHDKVEKHIEKIISDPNLLIGTTVTHETGAMDGMKWNNPGAVEAALKLSPGLPHLKMALTEFFDGSLKTWKQFTSEFEKGGLIDQTSEEERELAWMPPTNDVNEGVLGAFRVHMRNKPRTVLHNFNGKTMFKINQTQDFMDRKFTEKDHAFIRKEARDIDGKKLESKRQAALIDFAQEKVQLKQQKDMERLQKESKKKARLLEVELIFDKDLIDGLKGTRLQDQFDAYVLAGAPLPKNKEEFKYVGGKRATMKAAIDSYNEGTWEPRTNPSQQ